MRIIIKNILYTRANTYIHTVYRTIILTIYYCVLYTITLGPSCLTTKSSNYFCSTPRCFNLVRLAPKASRPIFYYPSSRLIFGFSKGLILFRFCCKTLPVFLIKFWLLRVCLDHRIFNILMIPKIFPVFRYKLKERFPSALLVFMWIYIFHKNVSSFTVNDDFRNYYGVDNMRACRMCRLSCKGWRY